MTYRNVVVKNCAIIMLLLDLIGNGFAILFRMALES